jgi:hypothetical protein
VVRELGVAAYHRAAAVQVLGLKHLSIRGQDELGLARGGLGAVAQGFQGRVYPSLRAGREVDVVPLEYAARDVRGVRRA